MKSLSVSITCAAVLATLQAVSGCAEEDAASAAAQLKADELEQVSTPVEVTATGFVAPPGSFNSFSIYADYETTACGLTEHIYGILGPSDVRIEECPDCLLPSAIELGAPPADFDAFACEPGVQGCEFRESVAGLQPADLVFDLPVCGEFIGAREFTVVFTHLNTTAPEEPRVFITASATFTIDEAGALVPLSDWTRCIEDAEGAQCTGPAGSY